MKAARRGTQPSPDRAPCVKVQAGGASSGQADIRRVRRNGKIPDAGWVLSGSRPGSRGGSAGGLCRRGFAGAGVFLGTADQAACIHLPVSFQSPFLPYHSAGTVRNSPASPPALPVTSPIRQPPSSSLSAACREPVTLGLGPVCRINPRIHISGSHFIYQRAGRGGRVRTLSRHGAAILSGETVLKSGDSRRKKGTIILPVTASAQSRS